MFLKKNINGDFVELFINQTFVNVCIRLDTQKDRGVYYYCENLKLVSSKKELDTILKHARKEFKNKYSIFLKLSIYENSSDTIKDLFKDLKTTTVEQKNVNTNEGLSTDFNKFQFYKYIDSNSNIYKLEIDNRENYIGSILKNIETNDFDSEIKEIDKTQVRAPQKRKICNTSSINNKRIRLVIPERLIMNAPIIKKSTQKQMILSENNNSVSLTTDCSQYSNEHNAFFRHKIVKSVDIDEKLYSSADLLKEEYVYKRPKQVSINLDNHIFNHDEYERKYMLKLKMKKEKQYAEKYNERNILQVRTMTKHMKQIRQSKKKKEARISKNIFTKVQNGDIICFFNDYDTTVFCVVEKVVTYKTFEEMFKNEKITDFLPNLKQSQMKKALDIYYSFKNYKEQEKKFGVVCYYLNNDVPQEKEYYY